MIRRAASTPIPGTHFKAVEPRLALANQTRHYEFLQRDCPECLKARAVGYKGL